MKLLDRLKLWLELWKLKLEMRRLETVEAAMARQPKSRRPSHDSSQPIRGQMARLEGDIRRVKRQLRRL